MKSALQKVIVVAVVANLAIFVVLAFAGKLPADPKQLIFIDFWGRFCVYSLWFMGYALYRRFVVDRGWLRRILVAALCINIPLFLGLGYFDLLSSAPEAVAVNDFWGRLTVYSLWFMAYELYRAHFSAPSVSPKMREEPA